MMIGNPDGIAGCVMSLDIAMPAHATVDAATERRCHSGDLICDFAHRSAR